MNNKSKQFVFEGEVRKSGNSLVVTIPNLTCKIHGVKVGDAIQLKATVIKEVS